MKREKGFYWGVTWGLKFGVWGGMSSELGFRASGLGFRVSGYRVVGLLLGVLECRRWGLKFRVFRL